MSPYEPPLLPPYRAVLVAESRDHEGSGRTRRPPDETVPEVLRAAFARLGRPELWRELVRQDITADGHTLGLDSRYLPLLVDPYLRGLRAELAQRHRDTYGPARQHPMRLRISLSVEPLPETWEQRGSARGEAHQLIHAQSVRNLLGRADPTVAFVAAILSERVFTDVVRAGHTRLTPAEFTRTEVRVRQYHGPAYLHLPSTESDEIPPVGR